MKSSIISAVVALAAFAKAPEEVPKENRYPDAAQGGTRLDHAAAMGNRIHDFWTFQK